MGLLIAMFVGFLACSEPVIVIEPNPTGKTVCTVMGSSVICL